MLAFCFRFVMVSNSVKIPSIANLSFYESIQAAEQALCGGDQNFTWTQMRNTTVLVQYEPNLVSECDDATEGNYLKKAFVNP